MAALRRLVTAAAGLVHPSTDRDARIARIGLRRDAFERLGDAARDLDDGARALHLDRADVLAFDVSAPAEHRDETARIRAVRRSPRHAEAHPSAGGVLR